MDLLVIAVVIGLIEMLIPLGLTVLEQKKMPFIKYLHIVLNILFITISLYYINFVPMYPHGPSPIWLAFPAWPAFMIFYLVFYPKILKSEKAVAINPIISGIYLLGSLVGIAMIIKDWNIG